jgi:hypothetical protein
MAEWDIGFEITAVVRMDVRNPNDKLVFKVWWLVDGPVNRGVAFLNRSQILAFFNVMAISGKVAIAIPESYSSVVHRLLAGYTQRETAYDLELLAKTKQSASTETNGPLGLPHLVIHSSQTVAFMKLSNAKIVGFHPSRAEKSGNMFLAHFDAS